MGRLFSFLTQFKILLLLDEKSHSVLKCDSSLFHLILDFIIYEEQFRQTLRFTLLPFHNVIMFHLKFLKIHSLNLRQIVILFLLRWSSLLVKLQYHPPYSDF